MSWHIKAAQKWQTYHAGWIWNWNNWCPCIANIHAGNLFIVTLLSMTSMVIRIHTFQETLVVLMIVNLLDILHTHHWTLGCCSCTDYRWLQMGWPASSSRPRWGPYFASISFVCRRSVCFLIYIQPSGQKIISHVCMLCIRWLEAIWTSQGLSANDSARR